MGAFQDEMWDHNFCWGCGPGNERGLRLKSHWEGEEAVATFTPLPEHMAGPTHVLNGGIIATIVDCHSICTATAAAYRAEGREIGSQPLIWCVTASLQITYLRPAPIEGPLLLRARVLETKGRKTTVNCSLLAGEEECANGKVVAVRVPPGWLEKR